MAPLPTGLSSPNCDLLLVGAGVLYFDPFDVDGNPTGLRDLGNCEKLEMTSADDKIEKFSSRTKARPLCKQSLRRRTITLAATLDEFSPFNVNVAMQGAAAASAAQAATAVVGEALTPLVNGVVLGGSYKVAKFGAISAATVKKGVTPLVLHTSTVAGDYTINLDTGVVNILNSPATAGLVDGDDLTIDYTPTAYADGLTQVAGGTQSKVEGKLVYVSDNTEGPNWILEVWKVLASPDGAVPFISEDFATMGLTFTVEDDTLNHPTVPLYRLTYV